MRFGFIGLGRMGGNMVLNLLDHNHKPVVYNRSPDSISRLARRGAIASFSVEDLVGKLSGRKIVWLMVPAGKPVDDNIKELLRYLKRGDIIIDGGNSYYKDSIARFNMLKKKGISYLDCGTSGGIDGARKGACMMVGGDKKTFKIVERLFRDMSVKEGYGYMGRAGAGHFVKMVHNAIEYGMMSAIGEGLEAIEKNKMNFNIDLTEVIKVYAHGSIIESRLVSWLEKAWKEERYLKKIIGSVPRGETEGEMEKLEKHKNIDMPVLRASRLLRVKSRKKPSLAGKIIAAMRNQFGGHKVKKR